MSFFDIFSGIALRNSSPFPGSSLNPETTFCWRERPGGRDLIKVFGYNWNMTHKNLHRLYLYVLGMWPCSDKMVVNVPQIERLA